jgi:hypothetical protein
MAQFPRHATLGGPATVAVHDDGDVARHLARVHIGQVSQWISKRRPLAQRGDFRDGSRVGCEGRWGKGGHGQTD